MSFSDFFFIIVLAYYKFFLGGTTHQWVTKDLIQGASSLEIRCIFLPFLGLLNGLRFLSNLGEKQKGLLPEIRRFFHKV